MNRRMLLNAGIVAALMTGIAKRTGEAQTPVQATPASVVTWTRIARDYTDRRTGRMKLYVVLTHMSDAEQLDEYFMSTKEEALEPDSEIYLTRAIEDAPRFGDESFVATGKLNVDEYVAMFGMKMGNLVYFFAFRGITARAALRAGRRFLPDFVNRIEIQERYTDEELFNLMPTEEETGFVVAWEGYETGEHCSGQGNCELEEGD